MSFYRIRVRLSWPASLTYSIIGTGGIILFAWVLGRDFPPGLLQEFTDLPWPLR
jgi:putative tricarboxylic transport membrane protein